MVAGSGDIQHGVTNRSLWRRRIQRDGTAAHVDAEILPDGWQRGRDGLRLHLRVEFG